MSGVGDQSEKGDDATLHRRISDLNAQIRAIRAEPGPHDQARIDPLSVEIDQLWDLLRQREARRDAGQDPRLARERPGDEVEGYLQ